MDLIHLNKSNNVGGQFGYRSLNITFNFGLLSAATVRRECEQKGQQTTIIYNATDQYNFRVND